MASRATDVAVRHPTGSIIMSSRTQTSITSIMAKKLVAALTDSNKLTIQINCSLVYVDEDGNLFKGFPKLTTEFDYTRVGDSLTLEKANDIARICFQDMQEIINEAPATKLIEDREYRRDYFTCSVNIRCLDLEGRVKGTLSIVGLQQKIEVIANTDVASVTSITEGSGGAASAMDAVD